MWYDISNQSKHAQEREKERAIIMATRYFAALDVGGTKADAVLFTESGEIVAHVIDPAGIPFDHGLETTTSNCKRTLDKLFSYADGPIETLYCAIATVEYYHPQFVEFFSKNFSVKKFRLEGDGCSLISSMLGHNDGACMVCGTGSALFVRRGDEYWHLGGGGHLAALGRTVSHLGIRQLLVVIQELTLADKAIGLQHTGKGLGEYTLTRAGLTHDRDGFIFIQVKGHAADSRQNTASDAELYVQILDGEQNFLIFHVVTSYIWVLGSEASPRFWPTTYRTTAMMEAMATGDQNSISQPGVVMAFCADSISLPRDISFRPIPM